MTSTRATSQTTNSHIDTFKRMKTEYKSANTNMKSIPEEIEENIEEEVNNKLIMDQLDSIREETGHQSKNLDRSRTQTTANPKSGNSLK